MTHRAADAALIALAGASMLWLATLISRGIELHFVLETLAAAAGAGIVFGLWRRPRPAVVMDEIDAQLHTHDLLATAAQSHVGDPQFAAILQSQADAFCRKRAPREVRLPHQSEGARAGFVLLAIITANVAWLRQSTSQIRHADASQLIATTPLGEEKSVAITEHLTPTQNSDPALTHEDADATERTVTQAGGESRMPRRKADSNGSAAAVTNDAHAQRLPAIVGGDPSQQTEGNEHNSTLAKDRSTRAPAISGDAIGADTTAGAMFVKPPAAYRDLIHAYFSKTSH